MKAVIVGCGRVGARLAATLDAGGHEVLDHRHLDDRVRPPAVGLPAATAPRRRHRRGRAAPRRRRGRRPVPRPDRGRQPQRHGGPAGVEAFGARRSVAKINDPVRAEAYAHLGIATLCRTNLMTDAILGFIGPAARSAQPGVRAPSGRHHEAGAQSASQPWPAAAATRTAAEARAMFVIVVGGGKVGYYLTKELIAVGPRGRADGEGRARARARSRTRSGRSCIPHDGCEGKYLAEAGANRADIVAAVTGDDEDNLVICQMAKHHFDVPRTIARVNNPKNEELFRHLGVDEIISPTRMILGSIEQDIPVHELLHLAALGGGRARADRGAPRSPIRRRSAGGAGPRRAPGLLAVRRDPRRRGTPRRPRTRCSPGDKVIAIGRPTARCSSASS